MITLPLKPAVVLGVVGMPFSVLLPVVRMLLLPVLLSGSLVLLVVGIGGHFLPLPEPLSHPLALATAAVALMFEPRIEDKQAPTVQTTSGPGRHGAPPFHKKRAYPQTAPASMSEAQKVRSKENPNWKKPEGRKERRKF